MRRVALIGGSLSEALVPAGEVAELPAEAGRWGEPSDSLRRWRVDGNEVTFLSRHGRDGAIAPHRVNYRANLWLVKSCAPDFVIGINAVGGIASSAAPAHLVIPDQLIDYTWGREHSYQGEGDAPLLHVDFTRPFDDALRARLLAAATAADVPVLAAGTYGVTQGPRLETAAEIERMARDGCDVVGMTAMPEAGLARELGLSYAICALVVNRAAGLGDGGIHEEINTHIGRGNARMAALLERFFLALSE